MISDPIPLPENCEATAKRPTKTSIHQVYSFLQEKPYLFNN